MSSKAKPKAKKAAAGKTKAKPKVAKTKKPAKARAKAKKAPKAPKEAKPSAPAPAPAKVERKEPVALGPAPSPVVSARHVDSMHDRPGRGFSFGELDSAGVSVVTAKREGLSMDIRRRSVVEGNVQALKEWLSGAS